MKRPADAEGTLRRIEAWRAARPDLVLRSTFIVGFPGETEREFDELLAFLEAAQLDRVGCFAYSPVEGATANALPDPVPDDVREERRARFMAVQEAISARRLAAKVGTTLPVIVDGHAEAGRGRAKRHIAVARSAGDAPEIDGCVHIVDGGELLVGSFARVRVTAAGPHDLEALVAEG
jgi:ribosomal protein S12 methylthiotransferase